MADADQLLARKRELVAEGMDPAEASRVAVREVLGQNVQAPPPPSASRPPSRQNEFENLKMKRQFVTSGERDRAQSTAILERQRELTLEGMDKTEAGQQALQEVQDITGDRPVEQPPGLGEAPSFPLGELAEAAEAGIRALRARRLGPDERVGLVREATSALQAAGRRRIGPLGEAAVRSALPEEQASGLLGLTEEEQAFEREQARARDAETAGSFARGAEALAGVGSLGITGKLAEGKLGDIAADIEDRAASMRFVGPMDPNRRDAGVPIESPQQASLAAFDAIPDLVQEAALSVPIPAVTTGGRKTVGRDLVERISAGQSAGQALRAATDNLQLDLLPLEAAVLGTAPEQRGLLSDAMMGDRSVPLRWWLRSMHKLEQRRTLGDDFDAAAQVMTDDLGIENQAARNIARKVAWGAGETGHVLAPWEMALAPAAKGAKVAASVSKLPKGVNKFRAFLRASTGQPLLIAKDATDAARTRVAKGATDAWDEVAALPEDLRDRVLQFMDEDGLPLTRPEELAPAPPPASPPPVDVGVPFAEGQSATTLLPLEGSPTIGEVHAKAARKAQEAQQALHDLKVRVPFAVRQQANEAMGVIEQQARAAAAEAQAGVQAKIAEIQARRDAALVAAGLDPTSNRASSMGEYLKRLRISQKARKGEGAVGAEAIGGGSQHGGFDAMKWMELDPDGKLPGDPTRGGYQLLDEAGDVVASGTMEKVAKAMLNRAEPLDVVQFRTGRDVAKWRGMRVKDVKASVLRQRSADRPLGQFTSSHEFTSPDELGLIEKLRADPRGTLPDKRLLELVPGLKKLPEPRAPKRAPGPFEGVPTSELPTQISMRAPGPAELPAQRFMRAIHGDPPVGPPATVLPRSLPEQQAAILDVIEDVLRGDIRSRFGGDLVTPFTGVVMTKGEHDQMLARAQKEMAEAGYKPKEIGQLDTDVVDGELADGARRYAGRYGVRLPPGQLDRTQISDAMADVIRKQADRSQDARLATRQSAVLSERLMNALIDKGQRPGEMMTAGAKLGVAKGLVFGLTDARLRQMPAPVRREMDAVLRSLKQVGREVLSDVQRAETALKTRGIRALHEVVRGYRPIGAGEAAKIEAIREVEVTSMPELVAWRNELREHIAGDGGFPELWSNDFGTAKQGLEAYLRDRESQMVRLGKQVLKAALPDSEFHRMGVIDDANEVTLRPEQLRQIWLDFAETGDFENASILEGLRDVYRKEIKPKSNVEAMTHLAMHIKSDDVLEQALQKIGEMEVGTSAPGVIKALKDIKGGKSIKESGVSLGEYAKARNILRRAGLEDGLEVERYGDQFGKVGDVVMPMGLVEEIQQVRAAGIDIRPKHFLPQAVGWLYRNYKEGLTIWNPAFHVGNAMGIPLMALQTLGARGTLRAGSRLMSRTDGPLSFNLARRLSGVPAFGFPDQTTKRLVTADGRMYSQAELERAMRRLGVDETFQTALSAKDLSDDIERSSGMWNAVSRHVSGARNAVAGASELLERSFRSAVFIDELKRGASLEQAGEAARRALYDYGTLTPTDKKIAKRGLVFWAFHRKNMDAFWKALVDNPRRLGTLIRFAQSQRPDESDIQKSRLSESDLGRIVLDPAIESIAKTGGLNVKPNGQEYAFSTTSANTAVEGLLFTRMMWAPILELAKLDATGAVREIQDAAQNLGGQSNPVLKATAEIAFDIDLGRGFRSTSARSNRIPPWMMEYPLIRDFTEAAFDPTPETPDPSKAATQTDFFIGRTPKFWTPLGRGRQAAWQLFSNFGPIRVITDSAPKALDVVREEPTQDGRFIDLLQAVGLHSKPVPSEPAQLRRQRSLPRGELNKLARDAEREDI